MNRKIQQIHFVGIGGIGMCGLAELLHNQGYRVTGSDLGGGENFERLMAMGVEAHLGHAARNIGSAQVVVASSAIPPDNPELLEARTRKIPVIRRAEMLAEIMRLKDGIAVAGSHGKTTTTSLIAHVLDAAELDPTAVIGGRVLGTGSDPSGARLGRGDLLVAEADESDGSFLSLAPVITVITNIDREHVSHYGRFETLQDAFINFANRVPFWGLSVVCIEHPGVQAIRPRLTGRLATYGFSSQADWTAKNIQPEGRGTSFDVHHAGRKQGEVRLPMPGRHNVLNALACLVVACELAIDFEVASEALAHFGGVERRFQRLGSENGVEVVDDYAHHPAELSATLAAARSLHPGRILVVFQPHRYSRTRDCLEEFATAFNDSDLLWVTEIYPAGEAPIAGISGSVLCQAISDHGHQDVRFLSGLDEFVPSLAKEVQPGDLVLTLGAGDIYRMGPTLLAELRAGDAGGIR